MSQLIQWIERHSVVHRHVVKWTILNISKILDRTIEITVLPLHSRVIKFTSSNYEWKLSIYGNYMSDNDYVVFSLISENIDSDIDEVKTCISLVGSDGKTLKSSQSTELLKIYKETLLDDRNKYLPNDNLTVSWEFEILRKNTEPDFKSESLRNLKNQITSELVSLYDSQRCSDVTLRCSDGSEFRAHKVILAARSPVFSSMFEHNMLENQANMVNILDIEAPVLRELLHHIYGKCSDNLPPDIYLQLYGAADKYQLSQFKLDCSTEIIQNLNCDNVCEVAVLADMHVDPGLFSAAKYFLEQKFLKSNFIISDTWIDFAKNSPDVALRLMP